MCVVYCRPARAWPPLLFVDQNEFGKRTKGKKGKKKKILWLTLGTARKGNHAARQLQEEKH